MARLPNRQQRTVIIGPTGSGKTVAGLWHLSNYDLTYPWVIYNFKDDEHILSIKQAREVGLDYVPRKKDEGVFIVTVLPSDIKAGKFSEHVTKLWERQNVGVMIDEMFMAGNDDQVTMVLTQGRSRFMPFIGHTQRPTWVSRFAFSEASFIQVFDLNDQRDIQTVESFVPLDWDNEMPLEKFQSWYYDVSERNLTRLNPVPNIPAIQKVFAEKLGRQRVLI